MSRGKRTALAVALAGLVGAGAAGVTLAQSEDQAPQQPSTSAHIFLLVPVPSDQAQPTDPNAASGEDNGSGSATAPDATPGTPDRHPTLILIPLPQQGEQAAPGNDEGSGNAQPNDESSGDGATRILVPLPVPHTLPDGILEA
jgi:hypothetical protein